MGMSRGPDTRASLLLRIRNPRDEQAWVEFQAIYEPLVYRLARRKGFQDADAHELTQEVLLAVANAIPRWDPDPARGSFRAWLFRIARNLMVNFLAREQRHPRGVGDTDFARWLEDQPAPDGAESAYFERECRRETFRWAAEQVRGEFHDVTWQAFWQTCVEGRGIPEVAKSLALSVGSVYVARSRVMARLREKIQRTMDD
jgi:RNA polymerase sigma-70 factor (ECF subfamily)